MRVFLGTTGFPSPVDMQPGSHSQTIEGGVFVAYQEEKIIKNELKNIKKIKKSFFIKYFNYKEYI